MLETVNTADENLGASFLLYLEKAVNDKYIIITGTDGKRKVRYPLSGNGDENFESLDEKSRAEFYAELIYKYNYPANRIKIGDAFMSMHSGNADILVFKDDACKHPYAVIETKANFNTDAEFNRVIEKNIFDTTRTMSDAEYVVVVSGRTRRSFDVSEKFDEFERERNIIADLPGSYGEVCDFRFYKGTENDIEPLSREDFISVIKKCHKTLWGGGRLSPSNAFGELCKLILIKMHDEQNCKNGEPYQFQIKSYESSSDLGERVRALYNGLKKEKDDVYADDIKVNSRTLQSIVTYMESINISETDVDIRRDAFEQLTEVFLNGENRRYFTPNPIVKFCVDMMKPKPDWYILDPACGFGGFITCALENIRGQTKKIRDQKAESCADFDKNRIFGIEKTGEIARVAEMNMAFCGAERTNIYCFDSLESMSKAHGHNGCFSENCFDLILTNLSYGSVGSSEFPYVSEYVLGNTVDSKGKKKVRKSQASEVLFIERIWQFLKPGTGKAAIVLPDNILTNGAMQYVRDFILEKFQLIAVVSLPQYALSYFGAGLKTSIVFVRKRGADEKADAEEAVFMAVPQMIGYDSSGKKTESQFDDIVSEFEKFERDATPFFA